MDEHDPYDDWDPSDDAPGLDEPENRFHFDELHPLIQQAAQRAWEDRDYHEAVIGAWHALRDRLRARLGSNDDGERLIKQINERTVQGGPPRLPLTDYDSETARGMHNGLVNLLFGIVGYVRNPEQHEESFVRDDKVGAFERLALLSLCARHVDVRTEAVSAEDALDELRQDRFPDTPETRAELVAAVRGADRLAFAKALADTSRQAAADGDDELASRCRTTLRQLTQHLDELGRHHVLTEIARDVDRLVSRDPTLDVAIRLLTPPLFTRLSPRNQQKVADRILEDVEQGTRTRRAQRGVFHRDAPRIFPVLAPDDRREFLRLVEIALRDDDPQRRTYGTWMAAWISRDLTDGEVARLAQVVAEMIASGQSEIVAELERRRRAAAYPFRTALRDQLAQVEAQSPGADADLQAARELVAPPNVRVRVVRSADERPR